MNARPFAAPDYETCIQLFRSNTPTFFAESEESDYREFLDEIFGEYSVFEDERGVVACGGIYIDEQERWIGIIWTIVRNDLRGQGIGSQMMAYLLGQIDEAHRDFPVYLDTSQYSRPFFEKLGFRVYEETPNGYAQGLHRYDMRLDLSPGALPLASGEEPG
jgi:ribosomal-protein-alanine N-acetyltransferase